MTAPVSAHAACLPGSPVWTVRRPIPDRTTAVRQAADPQMTEAGGLGLWRVEHSFDGAPTQESLTSGHVGFPWQADHRHRRPAGGCRLPRPVHHHRGRSYRADGNRTRRVRRRRAAGGAPVRLLRRTLPAALPRAALADRYMTRSATSTWTSMQSFAASPGTDVDPTWVTRTAAGRCQASGLRVDGAPRHRGVGSPRQDRRRLSGGRGISRLLANHYAVRRTAVSAWLP
jgi:hypothetical protein